MSVKTRVSAIDCPVCSTFVPLKPRKLGVEYSQDDFQTLADIVEPEAVKAAVHRIRERQGGRQRYLTNETDRSWGLMPESAEKQAGSGFITV
jgi:hypothetical protein